MQTGASRSAEREACLDELLKLPASTWRKEEMFLFLLREFRLETAFAVAEGPFVEDKDIAGLVKLYEFYGPHPQLKDSLWQICADRACGNLVLWLSQRARLQPEDVERALAVAPHQLKMEVHHWGRNGAANTQAFFEGLTGNAEVDLLSSTQLDQAIEKMESSSDVYTGLLHAHLVSQAVRKRPLSQPQNDRLLYLALRFPAENGSESERRAARLYGQELGRIQQQISAHQAQQLKDGQIAAEARRKQIRLQIQEQVDRGEFNQLLTDYHALTGAAGLSEAEFLATIADAYKRQIHEPLDSSALEVVRHLSKSEQPELRHDAWRLRMSQGEVMPREERLRDPYYQISEKIEVYKEYYATTFTLAMVIPLLFAPGIRGRLMVFVLLLPAIVAPASLIYVAAIIGSIGHNYANYRGLLWVLETCFPFFLGWAVLVDFWLLRRRHSLAQSGERSSTVR